MYLNRYKYHQFFPLLHNTPSETTTITLFIVIVDMLVTGFAYENL